MNTISINPPEFITDCGLSVKACRRRQVAASVLYILGVVISIFLPTLLAHIIDSSEIRLVVGIQHSADLSKLFFLIAFALLLKTCSNKASKVGLWMLIGIFILGIIGSAISFACFDYKTGIHDNQDYNICVVIGVLIGILNLFSLLFLTFYAYSLIFRNNKMDFQLRSWTNLLVAVLIKYPISVCAGFLEISSEWHYSYGLGSLYSIINYLLIILSVIAMVKLMMSDVFSGNHHCEVAEKPYIPLNRYVIGPLIAIVLTFAALWAYYSFAADMVNGIL